MYTSEQAAVTAIRELGVGWIVFPCDEARLGVHGYCAVKEKEELIVQWPLFGRELEPMVELVSGADLLAFVQKEPPELLYPCDDPMRRLYGFVSYRLAAEGKSLVRWSPLGKLKMMDTHPRAIVMETHESRNTLKSRTAVAKSIKPYGWLRVRLMRVVRRFWPSS